MPHFKYNAVKLSFPMLLLSSVTSNQRNIEILRSIYRLRNGS